MLTLKEAYQNTATHFGSRIGAVSAIPDIVDFSYDKENKRIRLVTKIQGSTDSYQQTIEILEISAPELEDGNFDAFMQMIESGVDVVDKPCKFDCECMDFYWRFKPYVFEKGSGVGKPPEPYEKKTNRKPLNPDKIPAFCKHLAAVYDYLF
jgi:hypothetical protein